MARAEWESEPSQDGQGECWSQTLQLPPLTVPSHGPGIVLWNIPTEVTDAESGRKENEPIPMRGAPAAAWSQVQTF